MRAPAILAVRCPQTHAQLPYPAPSLRLSNTPTHHQSSHLPGLCLQALSGFLHTHFSADSHARPQGASRGPRSVGQELHAKDSCDPLLPFSQPAQSSNAICTWTTQVYCIPGPALSSSPNDPAQSAPRISTRFHLHLSLNCYCQHDFKTLVFLVLFVVTPRHAALFLSSSSAFL